MNRAQEIATIDAHVALHGLYRCAPGESFYGDENVPLRDRMANFCRNRGRPRKARATRPCLHCGKPVAGKRRGKNVYCDRKCFDASRRLAVITVECAACGKPLKRLAWEAKKYPRSFCDITCHNAWRWRKAA